MIVDIVRCQKSGETLSMSIYLSVCLCLSVCLSICVCVSVYSTKQMIVDIVRCQKSGETLSEILSRPVSPDDVRMSTFSNSSILYCYQYSVVLF